LTGVSYGLQPQPSTEASVEASKKRKADAYGKATGKRTKVLAKRKVRLLKIVMHKVKSGVKRPSDMELALAKPMKRTKGFVFRFQSWAMLELHHLKLRLLPEKRLRPPSRIDEFNWHSCWERPRQRSHKRHHLTTRRPRLRRSDLLLMRSWLRPQLLPTLRLRCPL
jgi:hypothetical protein